MLEKIGLWLFHAFLDWLYKRAQKQAQRVVDNAKQSEADQELDEKQIEAILDAETKQERIRAAQDALRGL